MKKQLLTVFAALTVGAVSAQTASPSWSISQNAAFTNTSVGARFLDAVDANVVWVAGYDGFAPRRNYNWVSHTTNGGNTFTSGVVFASTVTPAIGDTNNYLLSNLEGIDGNTAWISAYTRVGPNFSAAQPGGGVIYRTNNGGASWTNMTATGMFTSSTSFADFVTFLTPSVGVVVGDPVNGAYEIWRTTNGGLSWNQVPSANIPSPLSGSEYAIVNLYTKQGTSNIWFGTNQGRIFYSTNSGQTWSVSAVAANTSTILEIAFNSPLNGVAYAFGSSFEMYNTTNGGATWTQIASPSASVGTNDIAGVPGTNYFVSVGAGTNNQIISYSTDNGVNWTDYGSVGIQYLCVDFADNISGWAGSFSDNTNPSVGGIWKYSGSAITSTAMPSSAFSIASNLCLTGPNVTVQPSNSSTGSPAVSYSWSASPAGVVFSSNTASAPVLTFNSGNTYTITLTCTNSVGSNSSQQVITVQACSLPTVSFNTSTASVCNNVAMTTTNASTGGAPAPSYSWSSIPATAVTFSPSSIASNPTIKVSAPGTYTIQLVGTNSQGSVSSTQVITVNNCAPAPNFTFPFTSISTTFDHCRNVDTLRTINNTAIVNGANSYTWTIQPTSGVQILGPTATNLTAKITNTVITVYTVTLKASNLSGTASAVQTVSVELKNCTGIAQNNLAELLSVYPNPAKDVINVSLPSGLDSYSVKLVNILGAVALEEKVTGNNKDVITINMANKPKGVYFLTVEANREKATRKIIIE